VIGRRRPIPDSEPLAPEELDEWSAQLNCFCARCEDTRRLRQALELTASARYWRRQTQKHAPNRVASMDLTALRKMPSWVRPNRD
jgi:hypothetical protein